MKRDKPICDWCAIGGGKLIGITTGPAAGMRFCEQHNRAYERALEGDPTWTWMLRALGKQQARRRPQEREKLAS